MPDVYFAQGAYRRTFGNLPELRLINMFVEQTPTAEGGVAAMSREGLSLVTEVPPGPIRALFYQAGTFGGDIFVVSGSNIYRGSTLLGTLDGNGPVSIAASADEVVFAAGGTPKSYNGTNLANISFPDGANVTAVTYVSQLFVFARAGTHRFYWSAINDGRSIDALDYASAETAPDEIRDLRTNRGNLIILGSESVEAWYPAGDADLPFIRIEQQIYDVGIFQTGAAAILDNTMYFVGSDGVVYRAEDVQMRVSDPGIEERLFEASEVLAFTFKYQGHEFFAVQHDSGTHLYDVSTNQWCEFTSAERPRWRVNTAVLAGRATLLGDAVTGQIWEFGGWTDTDQNMPLERLLTIYFPLRRTTRVDNIAVTTNPGRTTVTAGDGADPEVQFRASRDAGETWTGWKSAPLGAQGKYRTHVYSRMWGMFDSPGAMFEAKCDDPVPFRVAGAKVNETVGGRSRG